MNYRIEIIKLEPNPNFAEQLKEWKEREQYRYGPGPGEYPKGQISTNALICELTEEQFNAIKAAVFKEFI